MKESPAISYLCGGLPSIEEFVEWMGDSFVVSSRRWPIFPVATVGFKQIGRNPGDRNSFGQIGVVVEVSKSWIDVS